MDAAERKKSILQAARRTFAATGDLGAATTKMIAAEAGISEAIIYRHFESKDQLFIEAVVDPLREITGSFAETVGALPPTLTQEERLASTEQMFKRLITEFSDLVPLLGLVLFGEPKIAREFYRSSWVPFLRALGNDWTEFYARGSVTDVPNYTTAARIVAGASLLAALDLRFARGAGDVESVAAEFSEMMFEGIYRRVD